MAAPLTLATELAIAATRGRISHRGDYVVVETPDEPGWIDGNYLALPGAPRAGEIARWEAVFADELGTHRMVSLRWDEATDDPAVVAELADSGFEVDTFELMTADDVTAPPHALAMRALAPHELAATAELAWTAGDRHDEPYRQFLKNRARWQQQLVDSDRARFYGAFAAAEPAPSASVTRGHDGAQLVASLGVFFVGALARYQDVQTHPDYRRRGIASALLALAAADARTRGSTRFAILAQPGGEASRVYARVGFRTAERSMRAARYPATATGPVQARRAR